MTYLFCGVKKKGDLVEINDFELGMYLFIKDYINS